MFKGYGNKSTAGGAFNIFFASIMILAHFACSESINNDPIMPLPELPKSGVQSTMSKGVEREPKKALIALVGEVRGEIEPCGCPTLPFGGFKRRETLLNGMNKNWPVFHFDAGEMLLKGLSMEDRYDAAERSKLIISLSEKVGLDAWAAGPSDLTALGIEGLKAIDSIPIVNATWVDKEGNPILKPSVVIEKQDIRIGVIGISKAPTDKQWREKIDVIPPEKGILSALDKLPKDLDLIVALGSINDDAANRIASAELDIDLILTTRGAAYETPNLNPANTIVVESPERGRYVQAIYMRLGTDRGYPMAQLADDQLWRQWLLEQKQQTEKDALKEIGTGRNLIFVESIPLNKSYDEKATVDDAIASFKSEAKAKAKSLAEKEQEEQDPFYASAGACARCHSKESARWAFSSHKKAWHSLQLREETGNPECVICHSTGYAKPGGFGEMNRVSINKFKGVQCESCHGPMGGHPENKNVKSTPITPEGCIACHDEANSPSFDFSSYLKMASCQM